MLPRYYVQVTEILKNINGKIDVNAMLRLSDSVLARETKLEKID